MRVEVADHQQQLKEKHAGGPQGGGSSKPRQKILGQDQLHLKKQESTQKKCSRIRPAGTASEFRRKRSGHLSGSIVPERLHLAEWDSHQNLYADRLIAHQRGTEDPLLESAGDRVADFGVRSALDRYLRDFAVFPDNDESLDAFPTVTLMASASTRKPGGFSSHHAGVEAFSEISIVLVSSNSSCAATGPAENTGAANNIKS